MCQCWNSGDGERNKIAVIVSQFYKRFAPNVAFSDDQERTCQVTCRLLLSEASQNKKCIKNNNNGKRERQRGREDEQALRIENQEDKTNTQCANAGTVEMVNETKCCDCESVLQTVYTKCSVRRYHKTKNAQKNN